MQEKETLRQHAKALLRNIAPQDQCIWDDAVEKKLARIFSAKELELKKKLSIGFYVPLRGEPNFWKGLLGSWKDGISQSYFPVGLSDGKMTFGSVTSLEEIEFLAAKKLFFLPDVFSRNEVNAVRKTVVPDIICYPGLLFDSQGVRLGRGQGYYDHYFAAHPKVYRIAVCYELQVVQMLPRADHDQIADVLVTESRVLQISAAKSDR